MTRNEWCHVLGIERLSLAAPADHRDANSYALLLVALLERGQPMRLETGINDPSTPYDPDVHG